MTSKSGRGRRNGPVPGLTQWWANMRLPGQVWPDDLFIPARTAFTINLIKNQNEEGCQLD